jgi:crossover junction endodeoxyribonuclease RusA
LWQKYAEDRAKKIKVNRVIQIIKFTVPGRVVPAVRTTQKQKFVDARFQRYRSFKQHFAWYAKRATSKRIEGPVRVKVIVYTQGNKVADVDNLAKSLMDSSNGICWCDDKQVVDLRIQRIKVKHKTDERAEIEIDEIK